MKPKKLIMSAWGPYKEKVEIDFSTLRERGLFLITGATGAGKTTIFDAITYALYGAMSGGLREKGSVRSDFAGIAHKTYVELLMEHGGREYHIVRNPEYLRPKKRQSGKEAFTTEKENAVLTMADGTTVEGVGEVNRKLQEVLVLDYKQFKQISMIAQGEFARLLGASPAEKTKIFREIFSTAIYDKFSASLRNRSAMLLKQVMEYRHRIDETIHMLQKGSEQTLVEGVGPATTEAFMEGLVVFLFTVEKNLKQEIQSYEEAEKEGANLIEEISLAKRNNEALHALQEAERKRETLKIDEKANAQLEIQLKAARKAAELKGEYVGCQREQELFLERSKKEELLLQEYASLEKEREALGQLCDKKQEMKVAYVQKKTAIELQKQLLQIKEQKVKINKEWEVLKQQYVELEAVAEKEREAYEEADRRYKRAAVGIVARMLKEGSPCPVCGATEHPKIAAITEEIPDEERLRKLKESYLKANANLMEVHGKAAASKGVLEEKTKQVASVLEKVEEQHNIYTHLPKIIVDMMDRYSEEEYEKKVIRSERLSTIIEEKKIALLDAQKEKEEQKRKLHDVENGLEQNVVKAGFVSVLHCSQCMRDAKQIQVLEEQIDCYRNKVQEADNILADRKKQGAGLSFLDTEQMEQAQKQLHVNKQNSLARQAQYNHKIQEAKKGLKILEERNEKLKSMEMEYGVVKDLDNLAAGNNPKRLVFEQYVLASYFEEILRAANLRLSKMTAGRYQLARADEVSDGRTKDNLEINVYDNYTGKSRSVKTLSGGESFKASLSLALGMSDVIQAYSGGIRVEALFIDEGFGSLDTESLEQACQTLLSLAEKERMIGIISHVPELSEKIQSKIVITKTNVGSSLEVMV